MGWLRALWRRLLWAPEPVPAWSVHELNRWVAARLGRLPRDVRVVVVRPDTIQETAARFGLTVPGGAHPQELAFAENGVVLVVQHDPRLIVHGLAHLYGSNENEAFRLEREWTA